MQKEQHKQSELRKILHNRIRDGVYVPETCLPPCIDLARELGTSYVTMTRVVKALEKEGFLTAVRGKGTFVNPISCSSYPKERIVNLVIRRRGHPTIEKIVSLGEKIFSSAGWHVKVLHIAEQFSEVKSRILGEDAYFLFFGIHSLEEIFGPMLELVHKRLLFLGDRITRLPVVCITADEQQSIRLCMEHFHSCGLRQIALVRARSANELEMERAAVWRSITLEASGDTRLLWDMNISLRSTVRESISAMLGQQYVSDGLKHVQGIIAPDVEVAMYLIGFLMDHGIRVPEDVQVIAILDNPMAEVFRPQITCIDSNLEGHIRTALSILEERVAGCEDKVQFHLCQPRLILRGSTENAKIRRIS